MLPEAVVKMSGAADVGCSIRCAAGEDWLLAAASRNTWWNKPNSMMMAYMLRFKPSAEVINDFNYK